MHTVYVLHSPNFNKIYIGVTSDLASRLLSHNKLATKGYTIRYRPWVVVYREDFASKSDALARERSLKSANGRRFLWNMIGRKKSDHNE